MYGDKHKREHVDTSVTKAQPCQATASLRLAVPRTTSPGLNKYPAGVRVHRDKDSAAQRSSGQGTATAHEPDSQQCRENISVWVNVTVLSPVEGL